MFVDPMLARAAEESDLSSKDWTNWILEPKHDGMRAIVSITENGVEIYSRTGKSQKGKCPHIEKSLRFLPVGTVLDGEIAFVESSITVRGKSVPVVNFNKTMRIMGSGVDKALLRQREFGLVQFIIFDVIAVGGVDISGATQTQRFDLLKNIRYDYVRHNPRFESDFVGVYKELISHKVEGAILKKLDGVYVEGKRSHNWLKVKSAKTFDVVVSGFTDGKGKYEGMVGAIEFGAYFEDGSFAYVGRCSGMTDEERQHYTDIRDGKKQVNTPIVIEVKANEMVGSGEYRSPRHPQYVCVRVDKNPEDCLMDQFKA